jgi:hypothetical protein
VLYTHHEYDYLPYKIQICNNPPMGYRGSRIIAVVKTDAPKVVLLVFAVRKLEI